MATHNLNGLWRFTIDQDPEYHEPGQYAGPVSLRYWDTVPVPGCWNKYADKYDLYEGIGWFVREFTLEQLPARPVALLRFGGVNYLANVFLNGKHLGAHEGGYTPFLIDASTAIKTGKNWLAVRVDNRHLKTRLPAVIGWYNYGGIHRDVTLTVTSQAQLTVVSVTATPEGKTAKGLVRVTSTAMDHPARLRVTIVDASGRPVWKGTASGAGTWELPFSFPKAQCWAPGHPYLYQCRVELSGGRNVLDERSCKFGVRKIKVMGNRILHNGKPLYLKGMCYLYDHPVSGLRFDPEVVRRDLDDLQALGINCLRSHFPPPDSFLDECDRRGIMLWMEVPIYCVAPPSATTPSVFADDSFCNLATSMLKEMVEQAMNHPSVIIWSVGNECNADHPEARGFFIACVEQVRALDSTRLISYASLYGALGCVADLADVISVNQYWGWYDKLDYIGAHPAGQPVKLPLVIPELEACLKEKSALGKPVLLSEFGADAVPGYFSASRELWSENYQALIFRRTLEIASKYPAVQGTFPFLYQDYRDPSKPRTQYWQGLNLKGVVDYHRRHKLAWDEVQKIYKGKSNAR